MKRGKNETALTDPKSRDGNLLIPLAAQQNQPPTLAMRGRGAHEIVQTCFTSEVEDIRNTDSSRSLKLYQSKLYTRISCCSENLARIMIKEDGNTFALRGNRYVHVRCCCVRLQPASNRLGASSWPSCRGNQLCK